jgi:hypothetical protein
MLAFAAGTSPFETLSTPCSATAKSPCLARSVDLPPGWFECRQFVRGRRLLDIYLRVIGGYSIDRQEDIDCAGAAKTARQPKRDQIDAGQRA